MIRSSQREEAHYKFGMLNAEKNESRHLDSYDFPLCLGDLVVKNMPPWQPTCLSHCSRAKAEGGSD